MPIKKNNTTLNGYISKTRVNSESKLKFSESSFKFLQSNVLFYMAEGSAPYSPWCLTLQSLMPLLQRVNDEWEKVLNLLFLSIPFGNEQKLSKNFNFFTFGQKQCFYLTHLASEYFEILPIKKKKKKEKTTTLNGHISKTRANSESKLKFLKFMKVYSNLFIAACFCACSTHVGRQQGLCPLHPPLLLPVTCSTERVKTILE